MKNGYEQNVVYERLENGVDVYALQTSTKDVVVTQLAIPGGRIALRDNPILGAFLVDMFPYGVRGKRKSAILEQFEHMGAQVTFSLDEDYFCAKLITRKAVWYDAFSLLATVLARPVLQEREWRTAYSRVDEALQHAREETSHQAHVALRQQLFKKHHPLWLPSIERRARALQHVSVGDLKTVTATLWQGTGTIVTVVGDVRVQNTLDSIRNIASVLPAKQATIHAPKFSIMDVQRRLTERDVVVPIQGKENVHCMMGIPLALTYQDSDFLPVLLGVHILGSSTSSRLFEILRTKRSLTYGAYASMVGFARSYPGMLSATAIFPTGVFLEGRSAMHEVFSEFMQRGVKKREVQEHAEEIAGAHVVKLASTMGTAGVLFSILKSGFSLRYIDEYVDAIQSLTTAQVNSALKRHCDSSLIKSASSGGVQKNGKPL